MEFDGVGRDPEAAGRGLVAQAVAQRRENLDFAWRQHRPYFLGQWSEVAIFRARPAHGQSRGDGAQSRIHLLTGGVRRSRPAISPSTEPMATTGAGVELSTARSVRIASGAAVKST